MNIDTKATRKLEVILSDETLLEYGKEQSKLLVEIAEHDLEKARITAKAKPKKERVEHLATAIDSGKEIQAVDCNWEYDWTRGKKTLYRLDTGEEIDNDVIQEWEKQQRLRVA